MSRKAKWELRHDTLASKIWAKLPEQDRMLRQIRRSLTQRHSDYEAGKGSLLGDKELEAWRPYRSKLNLEPKHEKYFDDSELGWQREQAEQRRRRRLFIGGVLLVALISIVAALISNNYRLTAKELNQDLDERNDELNEKVEEIEKKSDSLNLASQSLAEEISRSELLRQKADSTADIAIERLKSLNLAYENLNQEKQKSERLRQRADSTADVAVERLKSLNLAYENLNQEKQKSERLRQRADSTAGVAKSALNSLQANTEEAMPILLRDIDNLILSLEYDTALLRCQTAWNLVSNEKMINQRFQEIAFFFTEIGAYNKAAAALASIGLPTAANRNSLQVTIEQMDPDHMVKLEKRYYPNMILVEEEQKGQGFYLAQTETTVWQYYLFTLTSKYKMPEIPVWSWQGHHPIVNVSWYDALAYANWLSRRQQLEQVYHLDIPEDPNDLWGLESVKKQPLLDWALNTDLAAGGYRLPTRSEWDYAASGGKRTAKFKYAGSNVLDDVAWFGGNNNPYGPKSVGLKVANELGLFDMTGNVAEWCWDKDASSKFDFDRILQGGGWESGAEAIDSSYLASNGPSSRLPTNGFRLARPTVDKDSDLPQVELEWHQDHLMVNLTKGSPPYNLELLKDGTIVQQFLLQNKGSQKIALLKLRHVPGTYVLEATDEDGQKANKAMSITIPNKSTGTFAGQTYKTIVLNGQTWLAENLNYEVKDSWCYGNDPTNCRTYGRLYTWASAQKACKALGDKWRLPTDQEWYVMVQNYGRCSDNQLEWTSTCGAAYLTLMEEGAIGFAVLLGGNRGPSGLYVGLGRYGSYWSATEIGADTAWDYWFHGDDQRLSRSLYLKSFGLSCRCVEDD